MTRAVCTICGKTNYGQGLCRTHHRQAVKEGRIVITHTVRVPCSVDGCDTLSHCFGMCRTHYRRSLGVPPVKERGTCTFPGCDKPHAAKGLCKAHHKQSLSGKPLKPLRAPSAVVPPETTCSFPGCDLPHRTKGYCSSHYGQLHHGRELQPLDWRKNAPSTPRVRPAYVRKPKPASILPPGWDRVTPKREIPKPNGSEIRMDGPVVIPPDVWTAARLVLEQHDALDLADMLGLAAA